MYLSEVGYLALYGVATTRRIPKMLVTLVPHTTADFSHNLGSLNSFCPNYSAILCNLTQIFVPLSQRFPCLRIFFEEKNGGN